MTRHVAILLFLAVLFVGAVVADADIIVADPNGWDAYSIELINDAGGIQVGSLTFSEFRVTSGVSPGGVAPGAEDIMVSGVFAEGEYGLSFNAGWAAVDGGRADTTIGFKVAAESPQLLIDNSLWISAFGASGGGLVLVTENVFDADPRLTPSEADPLANKMVYYSDPQDNRTYDHQDFMLAGQPAALAEIWVVKDIHVTSAGPGSTAGMSEVYQSFSEIPEPATASLLAIGAVGVLFHRKRRVAT